MTKHIMFHKDADLIYTGRNGCGAMKGLEVLPVGSMVILTAINSKGIARCDMQIPTDSLQDVIAALQALVPSRLPAKDQKGVVLCDSSTVLLFCPNCDSEFGSKPHTVVSCPQCCIDFTSRY